MPELNWEKGTVPDVVYLDADMQPAPKESAVWEKRWAPNGSVSFTRINKKTGHTMKVLVTGNLGFVGHHVTHELVDRDHRVIGVDRIDGAVSEKSERIERQERLPVLQVQADLAELDQALAVVGEHQPDAICHIAAQYSVKYNTETCVRYVRNNLAAFTYLMEAAKVYETRRFVYVSSLAISDEGKPSGLYGATKAYGEHCAHAYVQRSKMTAVGLRFGPIYGPLARADSPAFIALREYLDDKPVSNCKLFAKAMPYIYVLDAAKVLADMVTVTLRERHNVLLAASDEPMANLVDILRCAAISVGRKPQWPTGVILPPRSLKRVDLSSLRRVLGYTPPTKLNAGVAEMMQWMQT